MRKRAAKFSVKQMIHRALIFAEQALEAEAAGEIDNRKAETLYEEMLAMRAYRHKRFGISKEEAVVIASVGKPFEELAHNIALQRKATQ